MIGEFTLNFPARIAFIIMILEKKIVCEGLPNVVISLLAHLFFSSV
jgi:hypothetical protein